MEILYTRYEMRQKIRDWKAMGLSIGFVPTMGYLHEGHLSLIKKAREENDRVVVSIFVNPIQFAPTEDLEAYPRDLQRDAALCESVGCDLIFHPEPEEMYSHDFATFVDMEGLTKGLCGKSRPTHFRGVCTVVTKLFNIVKPDNAYFGQKDAQQLSVIRRMVEDLDMDIRIVGCPIVREEDGLAKSSRNTYLSPEEREAALCLSRAIFIGQDLVKKGIPITAPIINAMKAFIEEEPLATIDYVEAVDSRTITPATQVKKGTLFAMAVRIGKVRLIDNFLVE